MRSGDPGVVEGTGIVERTLVGTEVCASGFLIFIINYWTLASNLTTPGPVLHDVLMRMNVNAHRTADINT